MVYFAIMETPRMQWRNWANQLHRLRLESIAAWLLEAGAPVTLLGAQALFVAAPFLGSSSEAVAHMLEDEHEVRAFASFLREEVIQ
jgi:hypothetical protein